MATVDILDRLARNLEFAEDGCWNWTAYCNAGRKPYGRVRFQGRLWTVHRLAYSLLVGPVDDDLTVDHLCRNHRCFNPDHLEPVTVQENISRGTQGWNMRIRTHCPRGHEYDEANTYLDTKRNIRHCRACGRARMRQRRAAAK